MFELCRVRGFQDLGVKRSGIRVRVGNLGLAFKCTLGVLFVHLGLNRLLRKRAFVAWGVVGGM